MRGGLKPGAAIEAGKLVMPMNVSPDKRFLFAAVRSQVATGSLPDMDIIILRNSGRAIAGPLGAGGLGSRPRRLFSKNL